MVPLVSIIVPVYNVEDYLPTCLDSLLRQGIGEERYEVVLVNVMLPNIPISFCLTKKIRVWLLPEIMDWMLHMVSM